MNFRYENYLASALNQLIEDDTKIEVDEEKAFLKIKDLDPSTIYVVLKYLTNDKEQGAETQPVQMMILAKDDTDETTQTTKELFKTFTDRYNWKVEYYQYTDEDGTHTEYVKQQYSDPVVLSNFNSVTFGYRSVLYVSVNLFLLDKVVDLRGLQIDSIDITALTFSLSYTMTPNTQQKPSEFIASSVKSVSGLSIALSTPMVENAVITKILSIMNETDVQLESENTYGGNEDFEFSFYIGQVLFGKVDSTDEDQKVLKLKLISAQIMTSINAIPSIQLGFQK